MKKTMVQPNAAYIDRKERDTWQGFQNDGRISCFDNQKKLMVNLIGN